jgi:hypothetical protein
MKNQITLLSLIANIALFFVVISKVFAQEQGDILIKNIKVEILFGVYFRTKKVLYMQVLRVLWYNMMAKIGELQL